MRVRRLILFYALVLAIALGACRTGSRSHPHSRCWTGAISAAAENLWDLGKPEPSTPPKSNDLERAAVVAIALLAAFLTAVQVWQIPPPSMRISGSEALAAESAGKPAGEDKAKAGQAADLSAAFLSNNFVRTVLSGFTGLAAVTFLDSVWKEDGAHGLNVKPFYLVLFVVFFLIILLLSALLLSLNEAVRSRIILSRPAIPPLHPLPGHPSRFYRFRRWSGHWLRLFWNWLASWRLAVVVFVDTFFNFIQGRSQLRAAVFSDHIIDLHESMLQAAAEVRSEVHRAVLQALLRHHALPPDLPLAERIRVGIGLLSFDQSKVYYIAQERGSLHEPFDRYSVAWVATFVGQARWYKSGPCESGLTAEWSEVYAKNHGAVLYDNHAGILPGPATSLLLPQYFQDRADADYQAFLVLPMPWTRRGLAGDRRRGCILISFQDASYMDRLWAGLEHYEKPKETPKPDETRKPVPQYGEWKDLLETKESRLRRHKRLEGESPRAGKKESEVELHNEERRTQELTSLFILDSELAAVLHQALEVLGAALSHFDDEVYEDYVQLRLHSGSS
jgi:hypothetical protein